MNFTAIDFETAHGYHPCEIGLSRVEDGQIVDTRSWLIKPACFPYMNPYNEKIHGISTADVAHAPTFEELWSEIRPRLEDEIVVAHNASFDMGVLRASLAYYDLAVPHMDYFCSVSLSRRTWKDLSSHSLGNLCRVHDISFHHHRAGDDAQACAIIVLKAFQALGCTNVADGLTQAGLKTKKLRLDFP